MDFFEDTLTLEDELPQEHIGFLNGFMNGKEFINFY